MYAIVTTGSKQYRVSPGSEITVERLAGEAGDTQILQALCVVDGETVITQAADLASYPVEATIVEQLRGDKEVVFKFKKRKSYKKKIGHRQELTRLRIDSVGAEKAKPAAAKKAETADEADERESEKALSEAARDAEVLAQTKEPETEQQSDERTELKNDVELADIEYEPAPEMPDTGAAEDAEPSEKE